MKNREKIVVTFMGVELSRIQEYIDNNDIEVVTHGSLDITTKMDILFATFLVLKDEYLAQRMQSSYISDELKNKYRTGP